MADSIEDIFGSGPQLTPLQMSLRAVAMTFICLVLIRLAGRRSFGMGSAVDNVLAILIGAILSRGVVGVSPFWSVTAACTVIVALHRLLTLLGLYSHFIGALVKGRIKVLYENGRFNKKNMRYCGVSERDVYSGVREELNEDSLDNVEKIIVERSGKMSVIKKTQR